MEETKILSQLLAGFSSSLVMFNSGLAFGWSLPALPQLQDPSSELHLTSDEGAWVVSALMMGACFGAILSACLVNRIGRKLLLYSTAFPNFCCNLLIYFAQSFAWLFVARIINGISVGIAFSSLPMYLGEISESRIRGALGMTSGALLFAGTFMCYVIGPYVDAKTFVLICLAPTLLFLMTFCWMPETPYYYLMKKNHKSAERSLTWLRGTNIIHEELKEMANLLEAEQKQRGRVVELITISGNRKATLIIFMALAAQQFSGVGTLLAYLGLLFKRASIQIDVNVAVILTGLISLIVNIFASFVIDRFGRKPLLLTSTCASCVCLAITATFFHLEAVNVNVDSVRWLPVFTVIGVFVSFGLGLGPVPYTIVSEIYPASVKAWATTVVSIYGSLLGVVATKLYQVVADTWGLYLIFYIYATLEFLLAITITLFLPETKGKSLKEIQEMLHNTNK